ncbi:hypothetical protein T10_12446 [Trichinella papuae]|uniref:Uncharacterized protein n=1 Tax=Trichinella papuae TaxID=268474 RepID=A0A0V1M0M7_9BILA|nr:hypothetical protein T10_12446 [Trichinella papuae]
MSTTAFKEEFVKRLNDDIAIDTVKNVLDVLLKEANRCEIVSTRNTNKATAKEYGEFSTKAREQQFQKFIYAVLLLLAFCYFDVFDILEKSTQLYFEAENAITVLLFDSTSCSLFLYWLQNMRPLKHLIIPMQQQFTIFYSVY